MYGIRLGWIRVAVVRLKDSRVSAAVPSSIKRWRKYVGEKEYSKKP